MLASSLVKSWESQAMYEFDFHGSCIGTSRNTKITSDNTAGIVRRILEDVSKDLVNCRYNTLNRQKQHQGLRHS